MLVTGFPAGMFATNCYVIARDDASECVVIDPGQDAAEPLMSFLDSKSLTPAAVLLTHGHLDHMWDAQPVADRFGVPLHVHDGDRYMLTDPASAIGPQLAPFVAGRTFVEPARVIELVDGDTVSAAGIDIAVAHTPGHTPGSVVFIIEVNDSRSGEEGTPESVVFAGDTLFAGSIGRTDLPGGDHEQLLASIAATLLPLRDEVVVLPGHGPGTTIGAERRSNPFLVGLGAAPH